MENIRVASISQYSNSDFGKRFTMSKLVSSNIINCPKLEFSPPFNQKRCVISHSNAYVCIYPFLLEVCLWWVLFTIFHPCRIENENFDEFSHCHSVCVLCIADNCLFFTVEISCVYTRHNRFWTENIETETHMYEQA